MVFDTLDLHKPFVQVHDPASASMELEQVADGTPLHAVPAVPLANAPPTTAAGAPAPSVPAPAMARTPPLPALPAPAAVVAPPPHPAVPSSILQTLDLLSSNYTQCGAALTPSSACLGSVTTSIPKPCRALDNPEWLMADHVVVHWLYTTICLELLDAIMQPEDIAISVWTAIDGIFRDNQLARAVYIDVAYHAAVQGGLSVMQYCTKLKNFTNQLCDLGQLVTETR